MAEYLGDVDSVRLCGISEQDISSAEPWLWTRQQTEQIKRKAKKNVVFLWRDPFHNAVQHLQQSEPVSGKNKHITGRTGTECNAPKPFCSCVSCSILAKLYKLLSSLVS